MENRGKKNGSQTGLNSGGRGLNQIDECRHPTKEKNSGLLVFPNMRDVI